MGWGWIECGRRLWAFVCVCVSVSACVCVCVSVLVHDLFGDGGLWLYVALWCVRLCA